MTEPLEEDVSPKKKKSGKKEKDPNKVFFETITDYLLRPTRRRMGFLYAALSRPEEGILVMGTNPKQIVFGNPEEGLVLVQFKNREMFQALWSWLLLQGVDPQRVEAVDIGKLIAAVAREKFDPTKVVAYRNEETHYLYAIGADKQPASQMIYSLFTMNRYAYQVNEFIPALRNTVDGFSYLVPVEKDVPKLMRYVIPHASFASCSFGKVYTKDIRLMASRGYDLLCASQFPEDAIIFNGLRFWHVGGKTIYYAAIIDTPEVTFLAARCNVFLIPV